MSCEHADHPPEFGFEAWWAGLPDGWPITEPWKRVARAAWIAGRSPVLCACGEPLCHTQFCYEREDLRVQNSAHVFV